MSNRFNYVWLSQIKIHTWRVNWMQKHPFWCSDETFFLFQHTLLEPIYWTDSTDISLWFAWLFSCWLQNSASPAVRSLHWISKWIHEVNLRWGTIWNAQNIDMSRPSFMHHHNVVFIVLLKTATQWTQFNMSSQFFYILSLWFLRKMISHSKKMQYTS